MLHRDDKREYLEALEEVPELVETESARRFFLNAEDYNPLRAAARLARYWKMRKSVFGSQRWLLPLTQTGTGALNSDDIAILRSGYLVAFHQHDNLIVMDASRLPVYNISLERCLYYWTYTFREALMINPNICMLHLVNSTPRPSPNLENRVWEIGFTCLPIKSLSLKVTHTYEEDKQPLVDFLAFQTEKFLNFTTSQFPNRRGLERIALGSMERNLLALEQLGISRKQLPRRFGGFYDYSEFVSPPRKSALTKPRCFFLWLAFDSPSRLPASGWQDRWIGCQISIEGAMSSAPPKLNASLWTDSRMSLSPIMDFESAWEPSSALLALSPFANTGETRPYSPFVAMSPARTEEAWPTTHALVSAARPTLLALSPFTANSGEIRSNSPFCVAVPPVRTEEARLTTTSLAALVGSVARATKAEEKMPIAKIRNSIYCKKYYEKRKNKVVVLQEDRDALRQQNEELRREHERLEGLLHQAKDLVAALGKQESGR
jgi:hypothetical protein